ncbi:MAG TPA: Swt1 family HEPN domain-containing protein [Blastocatellia bacterium]|nr:Swt1 family HEPN domain-containing protein [Blastocatellia bacterium]
MDNLYSFVYRGLLTEEALDKSGRVRKKHFGATDAAELQKTLSFDFLDHDCLADAQQMSIVYTSLHAFENMVRNFVMRAMAERHGESWWAKVPERIKKMVKSRMDEDAKSRWHGTRGSSEVNYCDFGDLSSIIITNWEIFEDVVANLEWAKGILSALEKSRNIIMHGGVLAKEDVERIGINIRDWIRQAG